MRFARKLKTFEMSFQQLTIVIVSKNRPRFLLRQIKFWATMNCSILVLDGSDSPLISDNLNSLINFKYIHLPESVEHRLSIAAKFIATKYVVLMGDDDIFIPSGVAECINYLNCDPTIIAVAGTVKGFNYKDASIELFDVYPDFFKNGQLTDDSKWVRLQKHKDDYDATTVYSVFRRDSWINIVSIFEGQPEMSGNLAEILIEFCSVFSGKTKVIENLYWLRSFENNPQWSSFEPVGKWLLKIRNKNRQQLYVRLQINFFNEDTLIKNKINQIRFMLHLVGNQLGIESQRFGINQKLKWFLLPLMFFSANLFLEFKLIKWLIKLKSNPAKHSGWENRNSGTSLLDEKYLMTNTEPKSIMSQNDFNLISNMLSDFYSQ
jgi:glycosyltransferase domain-containing protein